MVHRSGWLIYCTWGNVYGAGASVDVRGYSASEWARAIPGALMDLQAGGQMTAAQLASLRTAAAQVSAGEVIPPDAACSLFSTILEAEGQPSGSIESVRTTSRPVDISAETCARGRYTSVTVSDAFDDKITLSKKLVQGVRIALVTARDRNRG